MKQIFIRASIIIGIVFLSRVLIACCDCFAYQHYNYDHVDIYPLDNSGPTAVVSSLDSIEKDAFGIRFDFTVLTVAKSESTKADPFTTASATECFCGESLRPRSVVATIEIVTINDFDAEHAANSDVTSLFKILNIRYDNNSDVQVHTFVSIADYFDDLPLLGFYTGIFTVDALLVTPPLDAGTQSFNVKVTMTDGRIFNMTTAPIKLY